MNKWVLGARPRTLPAAIAPVLVASALAGSDFNWFRAALALKVGLWLQIGVNFANDYSDGVKGSDSIRIGPTRLVASGLASAHAVARSLIFGIARFMVCGLRLTCQFNCNRCLSNCCGLELAGGRHRMDTAASVKYRLCILA